MNYKKWLLPCVILLICVLLMSYFVTSIVNSKNESLMEHLIDMPNTKDNLSTEKVDLIMDNIKVYLLSKYPTRKSISEDDKSITDTWEDLTINKNDMKWSNKPVYKKGFDTINNTLTRNSSNLELNDATFILKSTLLDDKEPSKENKSVPSVGEIVFNAELASNGKDSLLTIKTDGPLKTLFNDLMVGVKDNDSLTVKSIAEQIQAELMKQPNNGRIEKSPSALLIRSASGVIELRLPNGSGTFNLSVNDKILPNLTKVSPTNESTYYMVLYKNINDKQGNVVAYVNDKKVVDSVVDIINLKKSDIIINPNKNLNVLLEEFSVINKFLDDKEVKYFFRSDIVLKSILDKIADKHIKPSDKHIKPSDKHIKPSDKHIKL
jgi:hypothetical protein